MNDKREEIVWQLLDLQITSIILKQMIDAKRLGNAIRFTDSGVEFQTTCDCGKYKKWLNKPTPNGWWSVCCNERTVIPQGVHLTGKDIAEAWRLFFR